MRTRFWFMASYSLFGCHLRTTSNKSRPGQRISCGRNQKRRISETPLIYWTNWCTVRPKLMRTQTTPKRLAQTAKSTLSQLWDQFMSMILSQSSPAIKMLLSPMKQMKVRRATITAKKNPLNHQKRKTSPTMEMLERV